MRIKNENRIYGVIGLDIYSIKINGLYSMVVVACFNAAFDDATYFFVRVVDWGVDLLF